MVQMFTFLLDLSDLSVLFSVFSRRLPPSQMMPEIRVSLFGANPNRKFLD